MQQSLFEAEAAQPEPWRRVAILAIGLAGIALIVALVAIGLAVLR